MKRSESSEQILLIQWCEMQSCIYPELKSIFHIPNGGKRSKSEAIRFKKEGVKAGVPDLFLPIAKRGYHGLFIEMKYGNNKTTKSQNEWIDRLYKQGYQVEVCWSADEAIWAIKNYLGIGVVNTW